MSQKKIIVPIVIDSAAPTADDDKDAGFIVGMLWLHSTTLYVCTDASVGAATWTAFSGGGGGSGTVTSVGLALPTAIFDISGSPVTGAGTLTATLDAQTAKYAFLGPASGSAAAPTFRAIAKEDIKAALAGALNQGTNITITDNGDGTFTFAASGGGGSGDVVSTAANAFTWEMQSSAKSIANSFICAKNAGGVTGNSLFTYATGTTVLGGTLWNTTSGRTLYAAYDGYDFASDANTTTMWTNKVMSLHHTGNRSYVIMQFDDAITVSKAQGSTFEAIVVRNTSASQNVSITIDAGSGASGIFEFKVNGVNKWEFYAGSSEFGIYDYGGSFSPITCTSGAAGTGSVNINTLLECQYGIRVKEGSNKSGGLATLVGGTVVVSTTRVTANSRIQLTAQNLGTITVPAALAVSARTPGTSFTILSSDATDTSDIAWCIVEGF